MSVKKKSGASTQDMPANRANLRNLFDVALRVSVVLGGTRMKIQDILKLQNGSTIELDKLEGEALDILVNDKLVARGTAVVLNGKFGVRVTEVIDATQAEGLPVDSAS